VTSRHGRRQDSPFYAEKMVFGGTPRYPFSHGSNLLALPDGEMLCAWFAGSREKGTDVHILGARLPAGADQWSPPQMLADAPGKSLGNPVLHWAANGRLWMFYALMYGDGSVPTRPGTGWTTCKIVAKTSVDGGQTWSPDQVLIDELGYVTRNKAIALENSDILLPLHDERDWSSRILISADQGERWTLSERIDAGGGFHKGNIEPALFVRRDGSILCYMRSGADRRRIWQSISVDAGRNWSRPVEIDVANPNSAVDLLSLGTGAVVLAFNRSEKDRRRLTLAISDDEGATWLKYRDVEDDGREFSYPTLIQTADERIHLTYTFDQSGPPRGIKHVITNEAWVREGQRWTGGWD